MYLLQYLRNQEIRKNEENNKPHVPDDEMALEKACRPAPLNANDGTAEKVRIEAALAKETIVKL